MEIARPGDGVHLEHLADVCQPAEDLGVAALGDLERGEGEHAEAGRGGVEVGAEADDDPVLVIRSRRACTVPLATSSRRAVSTTGRLGVERSRPTNRASRSPIDRWSSCAIARVMHDRIVDNLSSRLSAT